MALRIGIVVAAFLVSTFGAWALLSATVSERARVERRLGRVMRAGGAAVPGTNAASARPMSDPGPAGNVTATVRDRAHAPPKKAWGRAVAPLARRLERLADGREARAKGGGATGSGRRAGLSLRLQRAGLHLKASEFQAIRLLSIVGGGIVGFLLLGGANGAVIGCPVGWLIPTAYLSRRESARLQALNGQIGDALIMTSNSLKAGYSFLQAMELVSTEMAPPLSEAFALALREMNLGAETEEALQGMADRSGSEDLEMVVTGVLIQRQVGGNLAEVLDNISLTIRERVRIQGEIKALTGQGRISGLVIGVLPVALFLLLMLINPAYMMGILQHPLGQFMLVLGVVGEILGAVLIRKIIQIEV